MSSIEDETEPYDELEAFDSLWQALQWSHIRKRVPVCFKKTLHNRYILANIIYIGYTIGLLFIDFHPYFTSLPESNSDGESSNETLSPLDQPVLMNESANRFYIGIDLSGFLAVICFPPSFC